MKKNSYSSTVSYFFGISFMCAINNRSFSFHFSIMQQYLALLFGTTIFLQFGIPVSHAFHHMLHGGNNDNSGILKLLAAGLIAKFLSEHHEEEKHHTHYIPIPIYIGHHGHHKKK